VDPPSAGKVVVVPFPFSDLSESKLRPALVLAAAGRGDFVLCQITSKPYADHAAVELGEGDFSEGSLRRVSYARPGKLFTANESLIVGVVGELTPPWQATVFDGGDVRWAPPVRSRGGGVGFMWGRVAPCGRAASHHLWWWSLTYRSSRPRLRIVASARFSGGRQRDAAPRGRAFPSPTARGV
jgi:mRNA interferase MazF